MSSSSVQGYSTVARAFHWLTAFFVLTMIPAGLIMGELKGGPLQNALFDYHRGIGVILAMLTILRLAYRLTNPPPPTPDDLPRWQVGLSHAVHWGFYLLLIANPFVGWVGTSAYGAPVGVFGLFTLPPIVAKDKALADQVFAVHGYLGYAMAAAVILHIGAALYHHFGRGDDVLRRMTGSQRTT